MGAELPVGHDPGPAGPARAGLLIRLLLTLFRLVFYPLLAWRRLRAAAQGGWVELTIDGRVPELPLPTGLLARVRASRSKKPNLSLQGVRALVDELLVDPRPRGLLVTLRDLDAGMATALSLRDLLLRLEKAGRKVVVHLPTGADTKGYFVASAAGSISLFPGASLALLGFASRGVYVRTALAKVGVSADILARGKYKSAGDALSRDSMSEPQREQTGALLDAMSLALTSALESGRGLSHEAALAAVDRALYRATDAKAARLVDAVRFDDEVAKALSPDAKEPPPAVGAADYLGARRATRLGASRGRPYVAVVKVHGAIAGGSSLGGGGAVEAEVIAAIRAARSSRKARGVILHIDSPGGSALASARMHRELELLAAEKPLVACMANVAASGGYYVAAAAHAIVAQPVTITGSIGVIGARFVVKAVLDRLGVNVDVLKRGARADVFDVTRPLEAEEREAVMREIEATYEEFLSVVARGRKKSLDEVESLAQGRVWAGSDAHVRGLVDRLGGFDVALEEVRSRIGAGGAGLEAKAVSAGKGDPATWSATPAKAAQLGIARELLGPWADLAPLLPLLLGGARGERVLAWAPDLGLGEWSG